MNDRERLLAVLNYGSYDRLPVLHFGFWNETLDKWVQEGHLAPELARDWADGNAADAQVGALLGFDYNYYRTVGAHADLLPAFERRVLEELPDGSRKVLNNNGVVIIEKEGATGIPPEVDHLLKDRKAWEEHYRPRLHFEPARLPIAGDLLAEICDARRPIPLGLHCGSLYGNIRNWTGMLGLSYLQADDPGLFEEMIETQAELCYQGTLAMLSIPGAVYDFGHFWEDICFKSGPLVNPRVFSSKVGPGYRRITDLLHSRGLHLVSLDCDGKIDALIPTWLDNGVNVMFPIEVGTWRASLLPWREKYGKEIRGVGGMDKKVFAYDYAAIDAEVERLKPLVDLGGFIPCPDHRIPPDAKWENVQHYCERMRKAFG
jgi:uroporphyrinogen decarboxylase